jgi:HlyD family secretion protein
MKKKLLWIAAGILGVALLVWIFAPRPTEVETAVVTKGRFERAIEEDGKTRLRERYVVSTPLAGRVARITLLQGDVVQRGTLLATLSPTAPAFLDARTEDELRARVGTVEASARRASVGVERARAARDQAVNELKRSETLAQQGFVSPNQNETVRLNLRLREKELESAQQDEHAASHDLEQARAALRQYAQPAQPAQPTQATKAAKAIAARAWEVRAPVGGKVLKVIQQSEGTLPAGTPIMEIGDAANLEVEVDILTSDASQVTPNMPVQMKASDGGPVIEGRVRLVEPAAFTKVSALGVEEQRVNAIIDITSPREKWQSLGDGFRLDVRILVQTENDAVMVPVSALFPVGNQSAVFAIENGRARLTTVDIAARGGGQGWVRQGIEPGAQVIVYPPATLKDGAKVVARK